MSGLLNPFRFAVPGGGAISKRYWRVVCLAGGSGQFGISELQMRAVAGGPDLTTGKTAIASSSFDGTLLAANAIDDDPITDWGSSNATSGQWIGVDFGTSVAIVEIVLAPRTDAFVGQFPSSIALEYSDDAASWTRVFTRSTQFLAGNAQTFYASTNTGKVCWRLRFGGTIGGTFTVAEMQMRATVGGADLTTGRMAICNNWFNGVFAPQNAIDDNTSTLWSSSTGNGANNHWLGVYFGADTALAEITVLPRNAGEGAPTIYVEYADHPEGTWTLHHTATMGAWTTGVAKTITLP